MTDSTTSAPEAFKERLFGDADAADGASFGHASNTEYPPITLNVARNLLNHNQLIVPTEWWEKRTFLEEAAERGDQWNAEIRFGGAQVDYGEGPQAHIDTVYFISDGEFSRETLKDIVETADMDASETTIEEIDGAEALRLWWDD